MDLCVLTLGEGSLRSVQGNHLSLEIERRELAVLEPLAKVRVFGLVCSGGGERQRRGCVCGDTEALALRSQRFFFTSLQVQDIWQLDLCSGVRVFRV